MNSLLKSFLLSIFLFFQLHAAITIDNQDAANRLCPGEKIAAIDNLTHAFNQSATGTMHSGWDIDRFHFTAGKAGLVTIELSAPQALTIKAGKECNTQTYFRSENKTTHTQQFHVDKGEQINLSIFDWTTGGGYDYRLGIALVPDDGTPPVTPEPEPNPDPVTPPADTTPPVITLLGTNPVILFVGDTFKDPGATANDNVDGDLSANITTTSTVNTAIAGTYTVIYHVSDTSGNSASRSRTVQVKAKPAPEPEPEPDPVTPPANTTITLDNEEAANRLCPGEKIAAIDNLTHAFNQSATGTMHSGWDIDRFHFTAGKAGLVTIELSAPQALTIKAGKECNTQTYFRSENKTTHTQQFHVDKGEQINLSIFDWTTGGGYDYRLGIALVPDDGTPPVTPEPEPNPDPVTPPADTTPPVITLLGTNPVILFVGDTFKDPGATANDNVDGDLSANITTTSTVNTAIAGTYTVIYHVSDTSGNSASRSRTVQVKAKPAPEPPNNRTGIIINEILAGNSHTNYDPDYKQFSDWIELYNNSNSAINTGGYYLSDDPDEPQKWRLSSHTIPAHGYYLIWCDKKANGKHTNFKLSQDGETLIFSDKNGNRLQTISYSEQESDISYNQVNGEDRYMLPTPKAANRSGQSTLALSKKPEFSQESGFYTGSQSIELTQENGGEIYYTTDGSIPTEHSRKYTGPITINKTTVIRARGKEDGKFLSKIKNCTYLIDESITLPVVSIAINDEYLWDDKIGIYVLGTDENGNPNPPDSEYYANYDHNWMRPAAIEYIKDGKSQFSENVGIRIFGSGSRKKPQKSLAIFAKDNFGAKSIKYPLFPDKPQITKVKSFLLRKSDTRTTIRDGISQMIVHNNMNIDYQSYHATVVFINGQYWGILNIREKINEDYLHTNHHVDPDNVDIVKPTYRENVYESVSGSTDNFMYVLDYIIHHNPNSIEFEQFIEKNIDTDELINYMISQNFFNIVDWDVRNMKFWREKKENTKWRWFLYDLDSGFWDVADNPFEYSLANSKRPWSHPIQRKLLENTNFKYKFASRFFSHLNITFDYANTHIIMDNLIDAIRPEIERHFRRWPINYNFDHDIDNLYYFAKNRVHYMKQHIKNWFGLSGNDKLTIPQVANGKIHLDGIVLQNAYTGEYFDGAKVILSAEPEKGYEFVRWSNGKTTESIEISLNNDMQIEAEFREVTKSPAKIVINEINYKSADDFDTEDWIELYNNDTKDVDLSGWIIKDSKDDEPFPLPQGTILKKGSYLVLSAEKTAFESFFPNVENVIGDFAFGLGKKEDSVRIFDNTGRLVDSVSYDKKWPDAKGNGKTLALKDATLDNAKAENWEAADAHGTPGQAN